MHIFWVVKGGLWTFTGWLRVVCGHFLVVKGGLCAFSGWLRVVCAHFLGG